MCGIWQKGYAINKEHSQTIIKNFRHTFIKLLNKILKEIGVKNIAINTHYLANQISDYVNKFDNKIKIFYEEKY